MDQNIIISHIVAAAENNVIGNGNEMPWKLPDDFKYFKNKTWGMVVIMGRKTYVSLEKPLPGRINIVITRDKEWKRDGVTITDSLENALDIAKTTGCLEIFIIGGGEVFKQSINLVNRIYLTRVHATFTGDVYYPEINKEMWHKVSMIDHPKDDKHAYSFSFEVWEKSSITF